MAQKNLVVNEDATVTKTILSKYETHKTKKVLHKQGKTGASCKLKAADKKDSSGRCAISTERPPELTPKALSPPPRWVLPKTDSRTLTHMRCPWIQTTMWDSAWIKETMWTALVKMFLAAVIAIKLKPRLLIIAIICFTIYLLVATK